MKNLLALCLIILLATSCSIKKIDPAFEGIQVNLVGDDKGISDIELVSGWIMYNPFMKDIYEYPKKVFTLDCPEFKANAKEGTEFIIDPTITLRLISGKGPFVFGKYRVPLEEVFNTTIMKYCMNAYRTQINFFTTDEIISNRDSIETFIENYLKEALNKEGFYLENATSGLSYPKIITDAVNRKTAAIQNAQASANELIVAENEAAILIQKAQGERDANLARQAGLTPLIIKQQFIEKWDGKYPNTVAGNGTDLLLNIN